MKNRILEIRKEKGIKLQELADNLQVDIKTMQLYQSGKLELSNEILEKLSNIFKCSSDYIVFKSNKQSKFDDMDKWVLFLEEAREKGLTYSEFEEQIKYLLKLKDKAKKEYIHKLKAKAKNHFNGDDYAKNKY